MAFWSDASPGVLEAHRGYRFLFRLDTLEEWLCKRVTKPGFSITETQHKFMNHTFFYPGRLEWNAIDVTLMDSAQPDGTSTLMGLVNYMGYIPPENSSGLNGKWPSLSKARGAASLGQVEIISLDAKGNAVSTWKLKNPWIKDVKFGDLSYDSDELLEISLSLRYDYATYRSHTPGSTFGTVGGAVSAKSQFPDKTIEETFTSG